MLMSSNAVNATRPALPERLEVLARRIDGAVDFWTTLCLAPEMAVEARRTFVREQCRGLESRLEELRSQLAGPSPPELSELGREARQLCDLFEVLVDHPNRTLGEVVNSVRGLLALQARWHDTLKRLARTLGYELSYWDNLSPEQKAYRQWIVDSLESLFIDNHPTPGSIPDSP
jgi:hypothetical protein